MTSFIRICRALAVLSLLAINIAGCTESTPTSAPTGSPSSISLAAAASTTDVMNELADTYEKTHSDISIKRNFAASSTLAQQIREGAPADLFLSASTKWVDDLFEAKFIDARHDLLSNTLVCVVPKDSKFRPAKPEDLSSEELTRLALADPAAVPAGQYAKEVLTKAELWTALEPKVAAAGDVRQALSFVEIGGAMAGIVYATDAAASTLVEIAFEFPANPHDPIVYPLALTKTGAANVPAVEFYEFLQSDEAAVVFKKHGFVVLSPAAP